MTKRDPNFVDRHVGNRVRMRRLLVGMSQEKLGELLGITFQQVQKYEKGSNRVSASRLYQISRVLSVPVQYFYDELKSDDGPSGIRPGPRFRGHVEEGDPVHGRADSRHRPGDLDHLQCRQ